MKITAALGVAIALAVTTLAGQETKPVPKNSVRVLIPGCAKGYIFTAARRTEEHPGSTDIPEGTHLRMNGPKDLMKEIKAHQGSMIEITGIMKKGQFDPNGIRLGDHVRIGPGQGPTAGIGPGGAVAGQAMIDVEGWHPVAGQCPS